LTLINVNTDVPIGVLTNGENVDLAVVGSELSICVDTTGQVDDV
jgi:hypothetical protein